MPIGSFNVRLTLKNQSAFERLGKKVQDFRPVWEEVITRWLSHNEDKFAEGRGAQLSGVDFDMESEPVMWMGVTDEYAAEKTRTGFENWLMVRTGELKTSLTERHTVDWWEEQEPLAVRFGTMNKKAFWNWEKRPTMFLDVMDRQMIRDMVGAYLNFEPPFRPWTGQEVKRMDAEFRSQFGGLKLPALPA